MSIINSKNVFANINNNFNLLSPLVTKVLHHVERINRNDKLLKDNTIFPYYSICNAIILSVFKKVCKYFYLRS